MNQAEVKTFEKIPGTVDNNQIFQLVNASNTKKAPVYFVILKDISGGDDREISDWLSINEKTYRTYKTTAPKVKRSLVEKAIMLISVFKHGQEIFGNPEQFRKWLETKNFFFDNKSPNNFLDTTSGIKFIDDRLTGMEYGDNV